MKTYQVTEMDYEEFNKLVITHLNIPGYDVACDEEWHNDSDHLYYDTRKEPLDKYEQGTLTQMRTKLNKAFYASWILITELTNLGVLEPGNYLIRVCY